VPTPRARRRTRRGLTGLDNPLADALALALVAVQQSLFSPPPTVKPVQLSVWTPGDPILGALRYIQPGGAPVSFELSQGPASGSVKVDADGRYTYGPLALRQRQVRHRHARPRGHVAYPHRRAGAAAGTSDQRGVLD